MARYGREYRAYDRQFGQRGGGYRRRYGGEYDRAEYRRGYDSGWGMSNLFNTIVSGRPPREDRYGAQFYHRPSNTPYGWEYQGGRRARRSPDYGSVGVHYRGGYDRY